MMMPIPPAVTSVRPRTRRRPGAGAGVLDERSFGMGSAPHRPARGVCRLAYEIALGGLLRRRPPRPTMTAYAQHTRGRRWMRRDAREGGGGHGMDPAHSRVAGCRARRSSGRSVPGGDRASVGVESRVGGLYAISDTLFLPRDEATGDGGLSDRSRERAPGGRALVLGVREAR